MCRSDNGLTSALWPSTLVRVLGKRASYGIASGYVNLRSIDSPAECLRAVPLFLWASLGSVSRIPGPPIRALGGRASQKSYRRAPDLSQQGGFSIRQGCKFTCRQTDGEHRRKSNSLDTPPVHCSSCIRRRAAGADSAQRCGWYRVTCRSLLQAASIALQAVPAPRRASVMGFRASNARRQHLTTREDVVRRLCSSCRVPMDEERTHGVAEIAWRLSPASALCDARGSVCRLIAAESTYGPKAGVLRPKRSYSTRTIWASTCQIVISVSRSMELDNKAVIAYSPCAEVFGLSRRWRVAQRPFCFWALPWQRQSAASPCVTQRAIATHSPG
jgi:hypothetical protein